MDLTCYVYDSWKPRIRPATSRRAWMDGTPDSFAYRCLPLAIANAHGWELLSPVGFKARWRGGQGAESVEIKLDPGPHDGDVPVSLFGQGTITFHVEGLFRTSPGWNLWVGGSPNAAKDGIAPLGGVIETDWSPYSFTMNWRFTRKNHWIRFEENEPFCFFFPVERRPITEMAPQIRPIEDAPEMKAAFDMWSKSRDAFQKWVRETAPTAPADQWQKLYYRGIEPDGTPGAADHAAKLRLKPFARPEGACPVAHAAPVAPPPVAAAALAPEASANPLLAPRLTSVPDDVMRMTLFQIGFDPKAADKKKR